MSLLWSELRVNAFRKGQSAISPERAERAFFLLFARRGRRAARTTCRRQKTHLTTNHFPASNPIAHRHRTLPHQPTAHQPTVHQHHYSPPSSWTRSARRRPRPTSTRPRPCCTPRTTSATRPTSTRAWSATAVREGGKCRALSVFGGLQHAAVSAFCVAHSLPHTTTRPNTSLQHTPAPTTGTGHGLKEGPKKNGAGRGNWGTFKARCYYRGGAGHLFQARRDRH